MHIVVPIKQVPETNAVKMDEATGTMIRDGVEAIVNPLDLFSIETALRLKQTHGATITAISMGPPKAERALREALSMGCDAAMLLSDKAFAGSDTWATARALAAAVEKLDHAPDLILCGERATDGDTGQVGPAMAAFLDWPLATYVGQIESVDQNSCRVRRLVEDGYETLRLQMPCLLTVVKEIGQPRLPTLRGKQRARRAEVPVLSAAELQVETKQLGLTGSPTRVVKIFRPKVARQGQLHRAVDPQSCQDAAARLVEFLQQRDLL
ncbi:MAG: electron transfer flavoprotein subunit beta/FixA family protein [Planctomycetota bacterium]